VLSVSRLLQLVFTIGILFGLFLPLSALKASILPIVIVGATLALLCLVLIEKDNAVKMEAAVAVFVGFIFLAIPMAILLFVRGFQ